MTAENISERDRKKYWKNTGGNDPLKGYDSFQSAYDGRPPHEDGHLDPEKRYDVICIDGRYRQPALNLLNPIRVAGSTIGDANAERVLSVRGERVRTVFSHAGCGRAELFVANLGAEELAEVPPDVDPIDFIAEREAERVAPPSNYGGQILDLSPKQIHPERAIYVDGTRDGFEAGRISTLPIGFGVSRSFFGPDISQDNTNLATQIAMGNNGLHNNFTRENPLYLVGVHEGHDGLVTPTRMRGELEDVRAGRDNIHIVEINVAKLRK